MPLANQLGLNSGALTMARTAPVLGSNATTAAPVAPELRNCSNSFLTASSAAFWIFTSIVR